MDRIYVRETMKKDFKVDLYTDSNSSEAEILELKNTLELSGISKFQHLHYVDENQVPLCIAALNTWITKGEITKFPVVVITKIGARSVYIDDISMINLQKLPIF